MKFTFKKEPRETGLRAIGNRPNTIIKHDKKPIGYIYAPQWNSPHNEWHISFTVKSDDEPWKWVRPKARFNNEEEGRKFVQEHLANIIKNNNLVLHYVEGIDE